MQKQSFCGPLDRDADTSKEKSQHGDWRGQQ
jgi:hypothetical protein